MVIHDCKDCPGAWAQLSTNNVIFCMRSRPYQREASRPSGPGRFFFNDTATTEIYTLSLHDAFPIYYDSTSFLGLLRNSND